MPRTAFETNVRKEENPGLTNLDSDKSKKKKEKIYRICHELTVEIKFY